MKCENWYNLGQSSFFKGGGGGLKVAPDSPKFFHLGPLGDYTICLIEKKYLSHGHVLIFHSDILIFSKFNCLKGVTGIYRWSMGLIINCQMHKNR